MAGTQLHRIKITGILLLIFFLFPSLFSAKAEDISMVYVGTGHGEQEYENLMVQNNSIFDLNYFFKRYKFESYEGSYLLLGAGYTYIWTDAPVDKEVHVISILPTYRYYFEVKGRRCFVNLTAGPSYMSSKNLGFMEQGSKFIFNDYVGIGLVKDEWELMFVWRHLSNAGIAPPNYGFNSHFNLSLSYYF